MLAFGKGEDGALLVEAEGKGRALGGYWRKLQVVRWGLAYMTQVWIEKVRWR